MPNKRWAINIDIEGFSKLFKWKQSKAIEPLRELMEAVFLIGQNCYPKRTERIFAHQIVDGFIIVSGFGGDTFEMPVAVSIAFCVTWRLAEKDLPRLPSAKGILRITLAAILNRYWMLEKTFILMVEKKEGVFAWAEGR